MIQVLMINFPKLNILNYLFKYTILNIQKLNQIKYLKIILISQF